MIINNDLDSSEYMINNSMSGFFSDEKYDVKMKTYDVENNVVAFSSKNLTQQNIIPFESCILYKIFQVFVLKLTGTCFVAIKINLENIFQCIRNHI